MTLGDEPAEVEREGAAPRPGRTALAMVTGALAAVASAAFVGSRIASEGDVAVSLAPLIGAATWLAMTLVRPRRSAWLTLAAGAIAAVSTVVTAFWAVAARGVSTAGISTRDALATSLRHAPEVVVWWFGQPVAWWLVAGAVVPVLATLLAPLVMRALARRRRG